MIADSITSIKAYLYERAVSPLLGSLIISWSAWNYKFFLLWVSDLSFPEKLGYVNKLYENNYAIYGQGILLPILTSAIYLFLFPLPAEMVYRYSLKKQKVLVDIKNEIESNQLLTVEQSRALRQQLSDAEKDFDELIERKNRAIEARDRETVALRESLANMKAERDEAIEDRAKNNETLPSTLKDTDSSQLLIDTNFANTALHDAIIGAGDNKSVVQQPDSFKFYLRLDSTLKDATENIMSLLLSESMDIDTLREQTLILSHSWLTDDFSAFKRHVGQLKLYDIVDVINEGIHGDYYVLTDVGKTLYKSILEGVVS